MATGAGSDLPASTILFLTLSFTESKYAVSCSLLGFSGGTNWKTWAFTVPLVLGVQARILKVNWSLMGETMYPLDCSLTHPGWPKSHGSRWAFSSPHACICWMAQLAAALWLGDPV